MTQWGMVLLAAYVGFGVSNVGRQKTVRLALLVTTIVLGGVFAKYGALR